MNKKWLLRSLVFVGFVTVLFAGCADPMKKAEEAHRSGSYDETVRWYEKAASNGVLKHRPSSDFCI